MPTHSLDLELSSSQYAGILDDSQTGLDISGDHTYEMWVKLEQLPSTATTNFFLVDKVTGSLIGGYRLFIDTSDNLVCDYTDISDNISRADTNSAAFTAADVGVWVHIAVSVDVSAQSFTFYKNGRVLANTNVFSAASSVGNGLRDFRIGANSNTTPAQFFDGKIKDVRMFSDIRTQSEIIADAHTENVSDANLVGEWNLNNAYTDSSGNGNTLTASGSPVFATDVPWDAASGVQGSTNLETNLVSYWSLDEASGTRVDAHGANDLTDNNTVGAAAGVIENGADFEAANSEYLSIADASQTGLDGFGAGFSISLWVKIESQPATDTFYDLVSKWGAGGGDSGNDYAFRYADTSGTKRLEITWNEGTTFGTSLSQLPTTLANNTLYHIVVVVDTDTPLVTWYIDAVESVPAMTSTAGDNGTVNNGGASFFIGAFNSASPQAFFDGIIDEVGIYSRRLTYGDVLDLNNGGAAIPYIPGVTVTPSAQALTLSIPAYTVSGGAVITPSVQTLLFSIPAYVVSLPKTVAVGVQSLLFSIPAYAVGISVNPSAQVLTFSIPSYSVIFGSTVAVAAQVLTFTLPARTIITDAILSVATQVLTFSLPALLKAGPTWNKVARSTDSTWSRTSRNST